MKAVRFASFGPPHRVAECVEVPDPGPPGTGEVVLEMDACPINPVDLLTISGAYAVEPSLPATPGSEGVGRVAAVGFGVEDLAPGDRVVPLGRDTWVQKQRVAARDLIKVPRDADILQLAMLKINPATAHLMMRDFVALEPGDWLLQDAANSAVGQMVIRLARAGGIRTVNVVRRQGLEGVLRDIGADAVVVDGHDLPERVRTATGAASIRLAVDAVAGAICTRLGDCLAEGATIVNYGLLSGEPCMLRPDQTVFRGITLTGFWLVRALGRMGHGQVRALYAELARELARGTLHVPVEATYPIEAIGEALERAARPGRSGKILITPNGEPDRG